MSNVIVSPTEKRRTHDISLSDGETTIGLILCDNKGNHQPRGITRTPIPRTALKTTSGNQKYSDFEPPWSPIAQENWAGGRGMLDFDSDITRYYDNWLANTLFGKIYLGSQSTYSHGYKSQDKSLPGSVKWLDMVDGESQYAAVKFTASASYTAKYIYLWLKRKGTPTSDLTIALCEDDGGVPGTVLQSNTVDTDDITDIVSEFYQCTITDQALTSGTDYWIKVSVTTGDSDNCWKVATNNTTGTSKKSSDDSTWGNALYDLYYRVTAVENGYMTKFFSYKRMQYAIINKTSAAPTLWYNGDRGVADANTGALSTLVDASKAAIWVANEWVNCIVLLIGGKGSNEDQPWRKIISNDTGSLTVDSAWIIEHDTTTEYVILGSNKWTELTDPAHGLTVNVTSVLSVNGICYLAQGDDVAMQRMRWYNNAGTATYQFAADGTNKAVFLTTVRDSTDGLTIWKANNKDATGNISVAKEVTIPDWGTDITFAAAILFKDELGKITGIIEYGDTDRQLWVFREGSIFTISSDKPDEIPLKEMHSAASYTNGIANIQHGVYLFFNFGKGLERFYNSVIDDIGANRNDGLPSNRQGIVRKLAGYPGRVYMAIDAGASGYSSIYGNSGSTESGAGWCEVYRAPVAGQRIWDMDFQPVPGDTLDRLWIAVGDDIIWIPFPSGEIDPTNDPNMQFMHESTITFGYMYAGLYDIFKFYHTLKIFSENLDADTGIKIEADFQVDEEETWTTLPNAFDTSPIQENRLLLQLGRNGKRLRIRLRLLTEDNSITPIVKGTVLENISRVAVKYGYAFSYRNYNNDRNLIDQAEDITAEEKQELLDQWATELTPLIMNGYRKQFHDRVVFIDPAILIPAKETEEGYIEQISIIDV